MPQTAQSWIEKLNLAPHPEGGHFRESYRSSLTIPSHSLPPNFTGDRSASTAIFFLLQGNEFSAFHRLRSDEVWHFYIGTTLLIHVIEPNGKYHRIRLGPDMDSGEALQAVVRAGFWFASQLSDRNSSALAGCTVAPGFDFEDFELGKRAELTGRYPQHQELIERLTRG